MSIKRITVSVPKEVAQRIKHAAGATPISTWLTELIEEHLDEGEMKRQWDAFYRDVNPGPRDIRRADALLKQLTGGSRRRRAA